MLIEKKISHKINYDVLRNLNKENELEKPSECEPKAVPSSEPVYPISNVLPIVQPAPVPFKFTARKRYVLALSPIVCLFIKKRLG